MNRSEGVEGRIVIYRRHFEKLLAFPKPLRDQLLIELPLLEGLRTGEISSLHVEYVDFENGDLTVLDSKKKQLLMIPLDTVVAEHLAEYMRIERLSEGILIRALPGAPHVGHKLGAKTLGIGLCENSIVRTWKKWCLRCGIPILTPRLGRAYLATVEHFVLGKPTAYIQFLLRHDDLQSTEHYLSRIASYEDQKAIFYKGKNSPFASDCSRSDKCPVAAPGCHCKFYQTRVEVQSVQDAAPLLRSP